MRIVRLVALGVALCLCLSGCRNTGEVENQAYALILGIDRLPGGQLRLTARVPKIGSSGTDGKKAEAGGNYLTFSAEGADWMKALEALERATPRPVNLSHISLLVVSSALASEGLFPALLRQVAETPHLYTTAQMIVCPESARDFIKSQDTVIGTRLSAELKAMLNHYADAGVIPSSSLADVYYATFSDYSDPVAVYARMSGGEDQGAEREGASEPPADGILDSPMSQRYEGAALFKNGVCVGVLDADETRALNMIRGVTKSLTVDVDGQPVDLVREGRVKKRVDLTKDAALLQVELCLSAPDGQSSHRLRSVIDRLQSSFENVIRRCQRLGVDPFGFSERAAAHYGTMRDWLSCGWRDRYMSAGVDVNIRLSGAADSF